MELEKCQRRPATIFPHQATGMPGKHFKQVLEEVLLEEVFEEEVRDRGVLVPLESPPPSDAEPGPLELSQFELGLGLRLSKLVAALSLEDARLSALPQSGPSLSACSRPPPSLLSPQSGPSLSACSGPPPSLLSCCGSLESLSLSLCTDVASEWHTLDPVSLLLLSAQQWRPRIVVLQNKAQSLLTHS